MRASRLRSRSSETARGIFSVDALTTTLAPWMARSPEEVGDAPAGVNRPASWKSACLSLIAALAVDVVPLAFDIVRLAPFLDLEAEQIGQKPKCSVPVGQNPAAHGLLRVVYRLHVAMEVEVQRQPAPGQFRL